MPVFFVVLLLTLLGLPETTEGPAFLRTDQVAAEYGFPVATLAHWRWKGVGPRSARVGNRVLYRRADLEKWIEEQYLAEEQAKRSRAN